MRKFLMAAAAASLALAASAAHATSFTLDSINVTANGQDPGLVVNINDLITSPVTFDLGATNPQSFDLFEIYTTESSVNFGEDTVPKNISVTFDFSAPSPNSVGPVTGHTFGLFGVIQDGVLTWNNGGVTNFTWGNGGLMTIKLDGGTFDTGLFGLHGGAAKGLDVQGTFDWKSDPVPEPASWALMITGFGMAGATLRRRRAVAVAA